MADPSRQTTARRRSSVAYDPIRDELKEIPGTISEDAIAEDEEEGDRSESSRVAPKRRMDESHPSSDHSHKRKRSGSSEARHEDRNGRDRDEVQSKKQRTDMQEPDGGKTGEGSFADSSQAPNGRTIRSVMDLPRASKITRAAGESRSTRAPQSSSSAYSRHSDSATDSRRPQNGERERERVRERVRDRNGERPAPRTRSRSRSPSSRVPSAYRRRSPPMSRTPQGYERERDRDRDRPRSPSPIRASPSREQVRPGGARGRGRNVLAEQQRLAEERERQQSGPASRSVQDVSTQWYNSVPEYVKERGRDWRRNESQIKGLRSFNNWVKSCLIQKFSAQEKKTEQEEELAWGEVAKEPEEMKPLLILDIGCGKGGDLGKWEKAPQQVGLYVGLDPADTSIQQAQDRYRQMWKNNNHHHRRGPGPAPGPRFEARFAVKDCFGQWIGDVPIVQEVGINPTPGVANRWGRDGGFDIVTMMFTMHYAYESKDKVAMMLRNVAGSLKKGGRVIGVCPNSDVLSERIKEYYQSHPKSKSNSESKPNLQNTPAKSTDAEVDVEADTNGTRKSTTAATTDSPRADPADENKQDTVTTTATKREGGEGGEEEVTDAPSWGNSIYSVRFPTDAPPPSDGTFRPDPYGWKYTYWMAEAVDVPEFVVPWEAFRAAAEAVGLEQRYRKGFLDIWASETDPTKASDPGMAREFQALAMRMGVMRRDGGSGNGNGSGSGGGSGSGSGSGELIMSQAEKEAVEFYHGFCLVKV